MKTMSILLLVIFSVSSCDPVCHEDLRLGVVLRIPLDLLNYSASETELLQVWRVNGTDTVKSELKELLLAGAITADNNITDKTPDGYYSSDLDGSSLYFYQMRTNDSLILQDSMTNITIKKSQEKVDDPCYADDPNIQIDELSFTHDGVVKGKSDVVVLGR